MPKKRQLLVAKKIEQLLPNIEVVEVVDRRPEVVDRSSREDRSRSSRQ